jgi:colicin import membrane protein
MGILTMRNSNNFLDMKWSPMVVLSFIFHVGIISATLFLPESIPGAGRFQGIVYEVDLVEMPAKGGQSLGKTPPTAGRTEKTVVKKATKAKKVTIPKKKAKPVKIAKRTVKEKTPTKKKQAVSPTQLIDEAVAKIEKQVKSETKERSHIDEAITKLENRLAGEQVAGGERGDSQTATGRRGSPMGSGAGIPIRMYQMEVEFWIKSNWAYPVALQRSKDLEAVVVLMVKRDGSIVKTNFKKRSSDKIFDQSVSKAIERSDPLPPFPEGLIISHDEIEITFNLKELENQ